MAKSMFVKPIPRSIAVFGASSHIARATTLCLQLRAPHVHLLLIASSSDDAHQLSEEFPELDVISADYFDSTSLDLALVGVEGLLVLTPSGIDEVEAMSNLVNAIRRAGALVHAVCVTPRQPKGNASAGQALDAKQVLDAAGIPVTHLMARALPSSGECFGFRGVSSCASRSRPDLGLQEVGETAAYLLISDDARHINQAYVLDDVEMDVGLPRVLDGSAGVLAECFQGEGISAASPDSMRPFLGVETPSSRYPSLGARSLVAPENSQRLRRPMRFLTRRSSASVAWVVPPARRHLTPRGSGGRRRH